MELRRITSLTLLLSFILLLLSSIILYIVPHGRIAYWSGWTLWGLSKTEWINLHVNLGFLFIIMIIIHNVLNWSAITLYLKNNVRKINLFNPNFLIAFFLVIIFTLGTYLKIAPFSWILDIGESIKNRSIEKYGEPPYGHAELSTLQDFVRGMGLDLDNSLDKLDQAKIIVKNVNQTLEDIAEDNNTIPKEIFITLNDGEEYHNYKYGRGGRGNNDKESIKTGIKNFGNKFKDEGWYDKKN